MSLKRSVSIALVIAMLLQSMVVFSYENSDTQTKNVSEQVMTLQGSTPSGVNNLKPTAIAVQQNTVAINEKAQEETKKAEEYKQAVSNVTSTQKNVSNVTSTPQTTMSKVPDSNPKSETKAVWAEKKEIKRNDVKVTKTDRIRINTKVEDSSVVVTDSTNSTKNENEGIEGSLVEKAGSLKTTTSAENTSGTSQNTEQVLASDVSALSTKTFLIYDYIESNHPYANNTLYTWNIDAEGASNIRVHFSKIQTEYQKDFLYCGAYRYTGNFATPFWSEWSGSSSITLQLLTDRRNVYYGFLIDYIEIQITDTTPPTVPTYLTADNIGTNDISLNWTASTDANGVLKYDIFRDGQMIGSSTTTNFNDTGLDSGRTYSYTVKAWDDFGNASSASSPLSVTTLHQDTTPPTKPGELVIVSKSDTGVNIAWTESTDNIGVTNYVIFRDGVSFAEVSGDIYNYSDNNVTLGQTYSYTVAAKDAAGNVSPQSNVVTVTIATLPDFTITDIGYSQLSPIEGELIKFNATLKNSGTAATTLGVEHKIGFKVDDSDVIFWWYSNSVSINPGESMKVSVNGGTSVQEWTAIKGSHKITAIVDQNNLINEQVETNNTKEENIVVEPLADLVVTQISLNPPNPTVGEDVTIKATIKNIGEGNSPAGRNHRVGFKIDNGATTLWADEYTWSIQPGSSVTVTVSSGTTGAVWKPTEGIHSISATVDDIALIKESVETNNSLTKTVSVSKLRTFIASNDYDQDGLSNEEELKLGTDTNLQDTDGDGLSDYEEAVVRLTNPLLPDTDGDGIYDSTEILLGKDPLVPDDNGVVEKNVTTADGKVSVRISGDYNLNVAPFQAVLSDNMFLSSRTGVVGKPIDISTGGYTFTEGYIEFKYSDAELNGISENNLTIFLLDNENKKLVPLAEQDIVRDIANNTVTGKVSHFSTYLLGDKDMQPDLSNVDVVFTIDQSGSMLWNDPNYYRLKAAKRFIEDIDPLHNRVGIVEFSYNGILKQTLTNDSNILNQTLNNMQYSVGGTNINDGLVVSGNTFDNASTIKSIILLTDGEDNYTSDQTIIDTARNLTNGDKKIIINTIGLSSGADNQLLQNVAGVGHGGYFFINDADLTQEQVNAQIELIYLKIAKMLTLQKITGYQFNPQTKLPVNYGGKYMGTDNSSNLDMYTSTGANLVSGNFIEQVKDLEIGSLGPQLELIRTYNSQATNESTMLGKGWRLNYESNIEDVTNKGKVTASCLNVRTSPWGNITGVIAKDTVLPFEQMNITATDGTLWHKVNLGLGVVGYVAAWHILNVTGMEVIYGSGTKILFEETTAGSGVFNQTYGVQDALSKDVENNCYTLTQKDQTKYYYGITSKKLTKIEDKNGNALNLTYLADKINTVTDASGRILTFNFINSDQIAINDSIGRSVTYNISAEGVLSSFQDPMGKSTNYEYYGTDNGNRLKKILNPLGKQVILNEYDRFGRLIKQYDENNYVKFHIYNDILRNENDELIGDGKLVSYYINENGYESEIEYNEIEKKPIREKDFEGRNTTHKYFINYNSEWVETTNLNTESSFFKSEWNNVEKNNWPFKGTNKDRNGIDTTYDFSSKSNLLNVTNPDLSSKCYMYDDKNNVIYESDEEGNKIYYVYDGESKNLIKKVVPLNGISQYTGVDSNDFAITQYIYYPAGEGGSNVKGLIKEIINPEGKKTTLEYNQDGYMYKSTDAINRVTTNTWTRSGFNTRITTPSLYNTDFVYDNLGRVEKITKHGGETTRIVYDDAGRKIKEVSPNLYNDSLDNLNAHSYSGEHGYRYIYNDDGSIKEMYDPQDYKTSYTYDPAGNVKTVTKPNGAITEYEYDALNRVIRIGFKKNVGDVLEIIEENDYNILADGKTTVTNRKYTSTTLYNTTITTFDYAKRPVEVLNPDNTKITTTYYKNGKVKSVTDAKNATTEYKYEKLGLLTEEKRPFVTYGTNTYFNLKNYDYDRNGNLILEKTLRNKAGLADEYSIKSNQYDGIGQLSLVAMHDEIEGTNYTQYYYDVDGNMARVYTGLTAPLNISGLDQVKTNGDSSYSVKKYDSNYLGRVAVFTDNNNNTLTNYYDKNGNVIGITDRNNNYITMNYDNLNRLTFKNVSGSNASKDASFEYTYDPLTGFITGKSGQEYNSTFVHNEKGQLIQVNETNGISKEYTYYTDGKRKTFVQKQNGSIVTSLGYDYDSAGRLWHVKENGVNVAVYGYDANGNRLSLAYSNGNTVEYDYNKGNKITAIRNKNAGSLISEYTSDYYLDGNIEREVSPSGTTSYVYDRFGRLKSETDNTGAIQYTYDDYSNRKTMDVTGTNPYSVAYEYGSNNQLAMETKLVGGNSTVTDYVYDNNGNMLSKNVGSNTEVYSYNGFNQLMSYTNGINFAIYKYDADGLRQSKTIGGTKITHIWDGQDIVMELAGTSVTGRYIRGINLVYGEFGGNKKHYLDNAHGDVVTLTDISGNVTKGYDYDAFGNEKNPDPADANVWRYSGEYFDKETGTIYLRARYYDPTMGRFINEDTYTGDTKDPLSLNLYTSVGTIR